MKNFRRLSIALLAVVLPVASAMAAGIDKGFYRKAAEKAWAITAEGIFDPLTEIPDSVAEGHSGVIIAYADDITADREVQNTMYARGGRTNRTVIQHISRIMVKLLDDSAIERYSEFEFGSESEYNRFGFVLAQSVRTAFGARIHKADGTVKDVDVSEALEVSDGRKGGENKVYKLAIPGLELGDVLEFFDYAEYMGENDDVNKIDMIFCDRYPVMHRYISGSYDPELTIEFHGYNGACAPASGNADNRNLTMLHLRDIPPVSFDKYLYSERQLPFLRLNVLNNYTRQGNAASYSSTTRRPGVHYNILQGTIYNDVMEYVSKLAQFMYRSTSLSPLPARTLKMMNRYVEEHPDATPRQLADAAQLALMYCNLTANERDRVDDPLFMAFFHNEVLEKLGIFPLEQTGIAFVNGRDEVPTAEMSGWMQTNFLSTAGGVEYEFFNLGCAPGEMRGSYQGETGARITGRLRDIRYGMRPQPYTVYDRKYNGNVMTSDISVTIDPADMSTLHVDRNMVLRGSAKHNGVGLLSPSEWIRAVENYLGVPEKKRYTIKGFDAAEHEAEVRDAFAEECLGVMGVKPDSITGYEVASYGFLPGDADMKYRVSCDVGGRVEDLGGDLSVGVGALLGHPETVEGSERERILDAMFPTAFQNVHTLRLEIPEGYTVDETSLADLNRMKSNRVGMFYVQARMNDAGQLEVRSTIRVKSATVPLSDWPMLRDIFDASTQFASASVILTRLQPQ